MVTTLIATSLLKQNENKRTTYGIKVRDEHEHEVEKMREVHLRTVLFVCG